MAKRAKKKGRSIARRSRPTPRVQRKKKAPQRRFVRKVSRARAARPRRVARTRKTTRTVTRRIQQKSIVPPRQMRQVAQRVSGPTTPAQQPQGTFIGEIQHYYTHLSVGVLDVDGAPLQVGDKIHIKGATTDFVQTVQSMQLEHQSLQRAEKGQSIGLKVEQHVREHDKVYRLS